MSTLFLLFFFGTHQYVWHVIASSFGKDYVCITSFNHKDSCDKKLRQLTISPKIKSVVFEKKKTKILLCVISLLDYWPLYNSICKSPSNFLKIFIC